MQIIAQKKSTLRILQTNSPIQPLRAWEIESFLLKTFEYGNYSFRKALTGQLGNRLQCTFFTAENNSSILAAAGCLYSIDNPTVAILGPVCTAPKHQKKGLASQICQILLDHLKAQKIQAVYLGVKDNIPAANLYKKLGFSNYGGIVMRKLFVSGEKFHQRYSSDQQIIVCKADWQDFAEVSALLCEPSVMYSFDFEGHPLSARSPDVESFLPIFPTLMSAIEKNGGHGSILKTPKNSSAVGAAFIRNSPSNAQYHIAFLDFFVLDGFRNQCKEWLGKTINQSGFENNRTILCCCPNENNNKKNFLLSLGAETYAILPDFIRIKDKFHNAIIYKLRRKL